MRDLSKDLELSQMYSNHDLRVTAISILARKGYSDKQIMSSSGHKSKLSEDIYKRVSRDEKLSMGHAISKQFLFLVSTIYSKLCNNVKL